MQLSCFADRLLSCERLSFSRTRQTSFREHIQCTPMCAYLSRSAIENIFKIGLLNLLTVSNKDPLTLISLFLQDVYEDLHARA